MKVGLILEGGAMRGIYSAGIIDTFLNENIKVDKIIGVSAGALFGMNYKSKQNGRVLRYNTKYANDKNYMGFYSFLKTGNIMNEDFCFNKLVHELDPVDFKTFRESPEEFYAVVTNLETGQAEYHRLDNLDEKDNIEYLRASGSMPFVSRPVIIKGKKYLDGGCADSIPINKMLDMDVDKIIVVLTRPANFRKKESHHLLNKMYYRKYPKFAETLNHRYLDYNLSLDIISHLENKKEIFVFRPSRYIKIGRLEKDVKIIKEMYDLGCHDGYD
ncbi:MAG: patatin family protein, partial [Faecalibacillus sp.]